MNKEISITFIIIALALYWADYSICTSFYPDFGDGWWKLRMIFDCIEKFLLLFVIQINTTLFIRAVSIIGCGVFASDLLDRFRGIANFNFGWDLFMILTTICYATYDYYKRKEIKI